MILTTRFTQDELQKLYKSAIDGINTVLFRYVSDNAGRLKKEARRNGYARPTGYLHYTYDSVKFYIKIAEVFSNGSIIYSVLAEGRDANNGKRVYVTFNSASPDPDSGTMSSYLIRQHAVDRWRERIDKKAKDDIEAALNIMADCIYGQMIGFNSAYGSKGDRRMMMFLGREGVFFGYSELDRNVDTFTTCITYDMLRGAQNYCNKSGTLYAKISEACKTLTDKPKDRIGGMVSAYERRKYHENYINGRKAAYRERTTTLIFDEPDFRKRIEEYEKPDKERIQREWNENKKRYLKKVVKQNREQNESATTTT